MFNKKLISTFLALMMFICTKQKMQLIFMHITLNNFNSKKYLFQYVSQVILTKRSTTIDVCINEQHLPCHFLYSPKGPYAVSMKNMDFTAL